ncbi:putative ankyrin repeat protein [Acrodontium crateriforme]|uniref:Ankyrin repeat protein n=1 Tax=Acrodontium crateriforme TaxID=150365 RepID=A0AAQ3R9R1_9PEZI|nr:putative ankyrin repeat protein [Acrodontium crateriforme]
MGLPQQTAPSKAENPSKPDQRTAPSELPPAAVELASKLFDFARAGKSSELEQYLEAGIPVNLTNHKGDTLLMLAAYHGHLETVTLLLDKGADVNGLNDRGQSVIAGAVFKGYDDVVRVLVDRGADVRVGQPSAVETAKMFKRDECMRLFGVEGEICDVPGFIPQRQ